MKPAQDDLHNSIVLDYLNLFQDLQNKYITESVLYSGKRTNAAIDGQ